MHAHTEHFESLTKSDAHELHSLRYIRNRGLQADVVNPNSNECIRWQYAEISTTAYIMKYCEKRLHWLKMIYSQFLII